MRGGLRARTVPRAVGGTRTRVLGVRAEQVIAERHGLVVAAFVHAAGDATACVIFADVVWGWHLEVR